MKKYCRIIILYLMLCFMFTTGFANINSPKSFDLIKHIKVKDVKSFTVNFAGRGENKKFKVYNFKDRKQTQDIDYFLKYLKSGKIQGYADEKVSMKGGYPNYIAIKIKNKTIIQIKSAVGAKVKNFPNGGMEISQYDIPNEVTVSTSLNERSYRIYSVKLRKLFESILKSGL